MKKEDNSLSPIRILHIESATEICSVALSVDNEVVAKAETADANAHSRNLILFVEKVVRESQVDKHELDAVCFSAGPGSYTGLRIGASTAKGLAYSLGIPLISIPTLESIAYGARKNLQDGKMLYCPMIDARRMEVFTSLYDTNMSVIQPIAAKVVGEDFLSGILGKQNIVFCGNGMPKCRAILSRHPNALFDETPLSAANMVTPAMNKFKTKNFEDTAYFEPFYLKEYIAAKSHVKGLK
ncbi:MAG: tRNA (adenosine(37)-N6)-threonylcarbamoyltransferase complex dimerization subunit type 1 TsaB [Bacteroidales bacterium]|nr:tRNA (adenosine(37)-N6)-threonylcarbamoyltransferase complex dimerization subunit type 1 TsaB [Bacteroidales bacterium]